MSALDDAMLSGEEPVQTPAETPEVIDKNSALDESMFGTPAPVEPEPTPEPEPEVQAEPEVPAEPEKPVQTPEENAKFAEQRRQKQIEDRAEQLAQERLKQAPEFQVAQKLSEIYGRPVSEILEGLEQARLERLAEQQQVSVESLQAQEATNRDIETAQAKLVQTQFEMWKMRVNSEATAIQQQYPSLTPDEVEAAKAYMLETLGNPDLPLDQAVNALYGTKIREAEREAMKQELLAELGNRKPSPIPPQGGKPAPASVLTDDEKYVARKMGLTEADYLRYK